MGCILSTSSSEAHASRNLFFCLSSDFHELWCSLMSTCLFTEVKRQWATLVLGWVTASVHYLCLMALQLALVDQNPFRPCFFFRFCPPVSMIYMAF